MNQNRCNGNILATYSIIDTYVYLDLKNELENSPGLIYNIFLLSISNTFPHIQNRKHFLFTSRWSS